MEIVKLVCWIIWGLVGIVSIGLTIYGFIFYKGLMKDIKKEEAE